MDTSPFLLWLEINVACAEGFPVGAAFEVLVTTRTGVHSLGSVAVPAGFAGIMAVGESLPAMDDQEVSIELLVDPSYPPQTDDMFDFWEGSLCFERIPVTYSIGSSGCSFSR